MDFRCQKLGCLQSRQTGLESQRTGDTTAMASKQRVDWRGLPVHRYDCADANDMAPSAAIPEVQSRNQRICDRYGLQHPIYPDL